MLRRHSSGNRFYLFWIPTFAGMTLLSSHSDLIWINGAPGEITRYIVYLALRAIAIAMLKIAPRLWLLRRSNSSIHGVVLFFRTLVVLISSNIYPSRPFRATWINGAPGEIRTPDRSVRSCAQPTPGARGCALWTAHPMMSRICGPFFDIAQCLIQAA